MSYTEFHQALMTHRKTYALASILRLRNSAACGHLAFLWCWALDNAPTGELTNIDAGAIARAADWPKSAAVFINALVAAGFVDDVDGLLTLHDWDQYGGKLVRARAANNERMKRARASHVPDTNGTRALQEKSREEKSRAAAAAAAAREDDPPPTTFDGTDPATRCYRAFMDQSPGGFNGTIRDHIDGLLEGGTPPEVIEEACRISAEEGGNKGWAFVSAVIRRLSSGQSKSKKPTLTGPDGRPFQSGLEIVKTGGRIIDVEAV